MTAEELEQIKQRVEALQSWTYGEDEDKRWLKPTGWQVDADITSENNMRFVADAKQIVLSLVDELERLKLENDRLLRVLMNIESAKRLHSGIPWEAMVMTLQDIARNGLTD